MLPLPSGDDAVVCFVGIDPGTTKPGLCLLYYDMSSRQIVKIIARVLTLDKFIRDSPYTNYQNEKFLRLRALDLILRDVLRTERPVRVASEVPFINIKRPGAVIPLAECLNVVENCVFDYNPYMPLDKFAPSLVKKAVHARTNSNDKNEMTTAILEIPELANNVVGRLRHMDNNAVDSIAVAYAAFKLEFPS